MDPLSTLCVLIGALIIAGRGPLIFAPAMMSAPIGPSRAPPRRPPVASWGPEQGAASCRHVGGGRVGDRGAGTGFECLQQIDQAERVD